MNRLRARLWALGCLLAALAFAASPLLTPGFNGFEPGQFPVPIEEPPVQPAGYAFAIWGLIYAWLIASSLFGLLRRGDDIDWQPMRPALFATLALGATWLPLAVLTPLGATVLIWLMLAGALLALFRAGDTDRWLQQAPLAVLAGWLTAAACVALGVVIGGYGWLAPTPAALLALLMAVAIALVVQYRLHRAPEYGITVIWALVGVIVQNTAPFNAAVAGLSLLGILAILSLRGTDTE
jgi:fucose 4-O-acetylase-like acetyltransferase